MTSAQVSTLQRRSSPPATMYDSQEELDNLVWDKNEEDSDKAQMLLRRNDTCDKIEELVASRFGKKSEMLSPLVFGGFNILYRFHVEDEYNDFMVRLPCPSLVQFPEEKTLQEAATAALLARGTSLPIPAPIFYDSTSPVGPFVIMDRVQHCGSVSARLNKPNAENPSAPHVLNPDISVSTLDKIWGQIARCQLQIARLSFPRIGSVVEVSKGNYDVAGRPITHNMTDMVRLANIPRAVLPPEGTTFDTADEWYTALAEMHLAQLVFQQNDLVTSEDDCRNKYVARQVFRRLARQGRLSVFGFAQDNWSAQSAKIPPSTLCSAPPGSHSFRLWGDDFRAGNILLNESDEIAALIDWEYTYAAPTQFSLDPPWWLLIDTAEMWSEGMDDWEQNYAVRLETWLAAMEKAEASMTDENPFPAPLSTYMRESWKTGRFFLSYGARKSWVFDAMYWKYLDERFFGAREAGTTQDQLWKTRIHLLTEEEKSAMEPFVEWRMNKSRERCIVDWGVKEAKQRFADVLFD